MRFLAGCLIAIGAVATGLYFWPAVTTFVYFVVAVGWGLAQARHFPRVNDDWRGAPD